MLFLSESLSGNLVAWTPTEHPLFWIRCSTSVWWIFFCNPMLFRYKKTWDLRELNVNQLNAKIQLQDIWKSLNVNDYPPRWFNNHKYFFLSFVQVSAQRSLFLSIKQWMLWRKHTPLYEKERKKTKNAPMESTQQIRADIN